MLSPQHANANADANARVGKIEHVQMEGEAFQVILRSLEVIAKLESHTVTPGASILSTYPYGDLRGGGKKTE